MPTEDPRVPTKIAARNVPVLVRIQLSKYIIIKNNYHNKNKQ